MTIDWAAFTPWESLAGGALIGVAAVAFAVLVGRVAGISGIIGGLLRPMPGDSNWRIAFLAGLVVAPLLYALVRPLPASRIEAPILLLVAGGLLVGWGSRMGSGCTSGHGVCGLARRSPRSLVATAAFMATGFATVFLARHAIA
jgi:uncharacterized protein